VYGAGYFISQNTAVVLLEYQNTMITGKRYLIPERSHKIKIDALNKYKHKVGCQINSRPLLKIPFFSNNKQQKDFV